jgi:hypothetical protein
MDIIIRWMDDIGAHSASVDVTYLRIDALGYLDTLRTGEMWDITLTDDSGRDVTTMYV